MNILELRSIAHFLHKLNTHPIHNVWLLYLHFINACAYCPYSFLFSCSQSFPANSAYNLHISTIPSFYSTQYLHCTISTQQCHTERCKSYSGAGSGHAPTRVVWPGWAGTGPPVVPVWHGPCLVTQCCHTLLPSLQFSLSLLVSHRRVLRDWQQRFELHFCQYLWLFTSKKQVQNTVIPLTFKLEQLK